MFKRINDWMEAKPSNASGAIALVGALAFVVCLVIMAMT